MNRRCSLFLLSPFFVFMLLSIVSCAREPGITIVYDAFPLSMDPHLRKEVVVSSILANIYEPLVSFDANMKISPVLSEYWEKVDGQTWRFTLRKGVKFHNGQTLTTADVSFSLYRALRMSESEYKSYGTYLDTIIIEDLNNIIIRLKNPYALVLYDLAGVLIVCENFKPEEVEYYGTGPYRFVKKTDDNLELRYFKDYWGEKPALSRVHYRFVPDYRDRIKALACKKADIITYIPLTELSECRKAGKVVANQGVSTRYLELNLRKYPFNNRYFRFAVSMCIDREKICRETYHGYATPANQYLPPGVFGFDFTLAQFPYNPDSAKKLLARLGNLPIIEFDYAVSRAFIAEEIVDDLTKIGLKIKANALEAKEYWTKVDERQSDFVLIASIPSSYEGFGTLRSSFHTKQPERGIGLMNRTGYTNPILDKIIEKIILSPDQKMATEMLFQAQKILLNDMPKIPIVWEKEVYGISERIDWTPRLDEMIIVKEIGLRR